MNREATGTSPGGTACHEADAHVEVVNPMEFKGETQTVTQYYCSVECLIEKVAD